MTHRKLENHDAIFRELDKVFPVAEYALFVGIVLAALLYLLFGR
ncbi:MAG TPA: hypothetical protein VEI49_01715 [Terriglobales bacterium]|nr:hypothetical protein [Terriglobales bacterium]